MKVPTLANLVLYAFGNLAHGRVAARQDSGSPPPGYTVGWASVRTDILQLPFAVIPLTNLTARQRTRRPAEQLHKTMPIPPPARNDIHNHRRRHLLRRTQPSPPRRRPRRVRFLWRLLPCHHYLRAFLQFRQLRPGLWCTQWVEDADWAEGD